MDSLRQRFDALPALNLVEQARPTDGSVSRINSHFAIVLPRQLVQLARHSANYPAYFLGLGADYQLPNHIIRVNSYWRRRRPKRRIPRNLVIITHGYMDDMFWCLDLSSAGTADDTYAVQFWCPDEITYPSENRPIHRYASFEHYIDGVIRGRSQRRQSD